MTDEMRAPAERSGLHVPVARGAASDRKATAVRIVVAALLIIAVVAAGACLRDAATVTNFLNRNFTPSWAHPFGTDWMGRDMVCRTLAGLSTSVAVGAVSAACSSVIALVLAALSTFAGARADATIEWFRDLVMGIPHLVLLILVSYALGRGATGVLVGVALTHWPSLFRVLRAEMLALKAQPFMACSRAAGATWGSLLTHHVVPHVLPQYLVGLVLLFPHAILHEASITFLGFGLSPEQPAIGVILSEAMGYLTSGAWWLAVFPGLMLLAVVLLFDRVGAWVRRLTEPDGAASRRRAPAARCGLASRRCLSSTTSTFFDSFLLATGNSVEKSRFRKDEPLLQVEHLSMSFSMHEPGAPFFQARRVDIPVLRDLSLSVRAGELVAVVGASGSGKTLLADAIMGLFEPNAQVEGSICFAGQSLDAAAISRLRGRGISLVPQNVNNLDPLMRVGEQVVGACGLGRTGRARRRERTARMRTLFREFGLESRVERMFPHELSGGMARRVLVTSALIDDPRLIVADEPTPGLDMELAVRALSDLRAFADGGGGVLLITHDLELALSVADRVAVFRDGSVVEETSVCNFSDPSRLAHPFSRALWHAMPEHDFSVDEVSEERL